MKLLSRRRAALGLGAWLVATQLPASARAVGAGVVVAFGDSITAGAGSLEDQGRPVRYPDRLAARLRAKPGPAGPARVVNAGIWAIACWPTAPAPRASPASRRTCSRSVA